MQKKELEALINKYQLKKKSDAKLVKWIYKDVHKELFTMYELENHFDDVFEKGYYNCLSATAIYGMILEELEVPYQLNILPNHVNLTAFPETHNITIETTDPVKGYFKYNKKFKEDYVANLINYKLVDPNQVALKSIDEIFDIYYTTEDHVNLKELVGAQYYNDGLYLTELEEYDAAIVQLEKAVALYPSHNVARVLLALYSRGLKDCNYTETQCLDYLLRITRYRELNEDMNEVIVNEFGNLADHNLLEEKDTTLFRDVYAKIKGVSKIASINKRIDFIHEAAWGDYLAKEMKYEEASKFYLNALNLVGDTANLEDLYISTVLMQVVGGGGRDMDLAKSVLESAAKEYPPIVKNKLFLTTKVEVISLMMWRSFESNKIKTGETYRKELEEILDNADVEILLEKTNVGIAYAEGGSAYFRRGSKSMARKMFKKGLTYCPGHYELEYRLSLVNY